MNGKPLMICAAMAMAATAAMAQTYNPYQSIGREARVLTLSNGKYEEFFDTDTLEVIGSAILNTKTMKVIGFMVVDTLYSEASLEPELVSRWLSPDPLAAKYPNLSPYNFAGNSPILYVDYDGGDYGVYVNHKTKTIVIKATIYTTRSLTEDRQISDQTYNRAALAAKYYENVKAQYIVKNDQGEDAIYTISFDFDVKEQEPKRNEAFNKATSDPEGNMFLSGIPGEHVTTEAGHRTGPTTKIRNGEKIEGYTEGLTDKKQYIYVEGAASLENPKAFYILDVHEMGHTMVSLTEEFHNQSGTVMQSDEHQGGGSPGPNLPAGFIENVLSNVGLGNAPVGENKPNATLHSEGGSAPANFSSGKVQNIQNNNIQKP